MRTTAVLVAAIAVLLSGCDRGTTEAEPVDEAAYVAEIETWRAEYVERLRRDEGWLSLVGLHWLDRTENPVGGAAEGEVVVPLPADKAPARVGSFAVAEGAVTFVPEPGVEVTADGEPVAGPVAVASDADGEPTRFELGPLLWYVIARGDRYGVRVKDRESAAIADFAGIETYPVDPSWRLQGRFVAHDPPKTIPVPTVLGTTVESESPGVVELERDGEVLRLDALDGGEDELWLIFGDATNRTATYGGGRFLYAPRPDAEGRLTVDFNKAYNPPCAYTQYATCPLPWPENRLDVAVTAGEKRFPGGHHG